MKLVYLLLNILCWHFSLSFPNLNNIQLVTDVAASYEQPTVVIAEVCWKNLHKYKLAKNLAQERQIAVTFSHKSKLINNNRQGNHLLFILDARCPTYKIFLNQASENNMFSKIYRWLLIGNSNTVIEELANINILVDSEFIIATEQETGDFLLQTVYKIKPEAELILEYYGNWTTKTGFNKSPNTIMSNAMRRKDLKGTEIAASFVINDNKTQYDLADLTNTLIDSITKSSFHAVNNLYEFLNATRLFLFTQSWGYPVNGSWTGMVGHLLKGKADLCGSVLFINKERLVILEYITIPGVTTMSKIVYKQPPLSYQFNLFTLPFTSEVWCCLGGFVVILTLILYVNTKWDIYKFKDYKEKNLNETCLAATWSDIIIFVISAITQQGSSQELKGTLGRLVMFIVFLAFVFFYTSYSANIVVLLQSTSKQIRTVNDLTNSKLEFGIEDAAYHRHYFTAAYTHDPVRKAFYETKISPKGSKPNFLSLEEGVKRLQTEPFAFNMNIGIGYKIVSKYFQEHEKCGLQEIDYVQGRKPWFCSKNGSPFSEMYRIGFFRMEEHGLNTRHNRIIFAKKPTCTVTGGNFGSVKMVDFYPVLLFLVYGIIVAFVILLLEILVHRKQKLRDNLQQET